MGGRCRDKEWALHLAASPGRPGSPHSPCCSPHSPQVPHSLVSVPWETPAPTIYLHLWSQQVSSLQFFCYRHGDRWVFGFSCITGLIMPESSALLMHQLWMNYSSYSYTRLPTPSVRVRMSRVAVQVRVLLGKSTATSQSQWLTTTPQLLALEHVSFLLHGSIGSQGRLR